MTVFGASLTLVVRIGIGHWRSELVNPVPRTYVLGFGELPFKGIRNIHSRTHDWGVLWFGVNVAKDIFAWRFFARDLKMDVK